MSNNLPTEQEKKKFNWKSWASGYVVAGLIFGLAQQAGFSKTTGGEVVSIIVAIGAGYFYHRLKAKIKIKNETIRAIITFIVLEIIAGALVGFFGNLLLNFNDAFINVITGLIAIVFSPVSALYAALLTIPLVGTIMKLMLLLFIFPAELVDIPRKFFLFH